MQIPLLVIEKSIRRGTLLDLTFINKGGFIGELKGEGTIDFSDNEMADFRILRGQSQAKKKARSQPYSSGQQIFFLFRYLPERIPWDMALSWRGGQESWLLFNNPLLQAQKQFTQEVWMNKELLAKPEHEKKA